MIRTSTQPRYSKRRHVRKVAFIVALVFVLAIGGGAFLVRRAYNQNLRAVSASQKNIQFTVEPDSGVSDVAANLKKAGLIRSAWAFEWYFRNNGLNQYLQAGTYSLRPNLTVPEIADTLTTGKIETSLVTIPPGLRIDQVRQMLVDKYGFTVESVDAALNPANYANHPALVDKPKGATLEGYLFPESFQKTAESSPQKIVQSSLDEMQGALTPELRAGIVRQGLTVHQGIILASVLEQEVSDPNDKKIVAQVLLKRLREDRALQSDKIKIVGAILAGQKPSITYDSAYNTYTHKGLPPTPISNVSRGSLDAVASPSSTDYLYFVAGDDGKTYFSRTLAEHEALTAQHCKTLCQ